MYDYNHKIMYKTNKKLLESLMNFMRLIISKSDACWQDERKEIVFLIHKV